MGGNDLICSICGGDRIDRATIQRSVDERFPLGLCWDCRDRMPLPPPKDAPKDKQIAYANAASRKAKHPLSPLMPRSEWQDRKRRTRSAPTTDLWGELPSEDQKRLTQPITLRR